MLGLQSCHDFRSIVPNDIVCSLVNLESFFAILIFIFGTLVINGPTTTDEGRNIERVGWHLTAIVEIKCLTTELSENKSVQKSGTQRLLFLTAILAKPEFMFENRHADIICSQLVLKIFKKRCTKILISTPTNSF